jgi:hypothetical protein
MSFWNGAPGEGRPYKARGPAWPAPSPPPLPGAWPSAPLLQQGPDQGGAPKGPGAGLANLRGLARLPIQRGRLPKAPPRSGQPFGAGGPKAPGLGPGASRLAGVHCSPPPHGPPWLWPVGRGSLHPGSRAPKFGRLFPSAPAAGFKPAPYHILLEVKDPDD